MSALQSRWAQLVLGILCMVMIANLQYGWTLFVLPIGQAHDWSRAAIQFAFAVFVICETWLLPFEGYVIDRIGPKLTVCAGGVLIGASWVVNSVADTLTVLYAAAATRRHRRGIRLWCNRRERHQVVPRPPRVGGGPHGGRLWCGVGRNVGPDIGDDRPGWLPNGLPGLRHPARCRGSHSVAVAQAASRAGNQARGRHGAQRHDRDAALPPA